MVFALCLFAGFSLIHELKTEHREGELSTEIHIKQVLRKAVRINVTW